MFTLPFLRPAGTSDVKEFPQSTATTSQSHWPPHVGQQSPLPALRYFTHTEHGYVQLDSSITLLLWSHFLLRIAQCPAHLPYLTVLVVKLATKLCSIVPSPTLRPHATHQRIS
jgi:hypothetical protein